MARARARWLDDPRMLRGALISVIIFTAILAVWFMGSPVKTTPAVEVPIQDWRRPVTVAPPKADFANKTAVIVETRMLPNLIPLILHFSAVLGSSWQVVLFTLENVWQMPASPPFRRVVREGHVKIQFLPPGTDLTKWESTSQFLTRPWLWEQVQDASRVLFFQTDSIICSNSNWTVEDFLEWDFIGAPLDPAWPQEGYNGGLSLRNPKLILDILDSPDNDFDENWAANRTDLIIEDRWYYNKMKKLRHVKLPDIETAKRFSVETMWYQWPLGFHKPLVWNAAHMDEIRKYCPEVGLINKEKSALDSGN